MKILRERNEVARRLAEAGREGRPLLCPNAETPAEMEGILLGAQRRAEESGRAEVTVGIGVTATYPDHPQLGRLALGRGAEGLARAARLWLGWLEAYAGESFDRVSVIPFLDHGWAPSESDRSLMEAEWFQDAMGIILFDASLHEWERNVELTAEYAAKARGRVVVEACPDKVYERAEMERKGLRGTDLLSCPERVEVFAKATGADVLVPNLGTEHRTRSRETLEYRRDLAKDIARRVGPVLALHGTSSLGDRLGRVGEDGVCKVNFYSAMARDAGERQRSAWEEFSREAPLPVAAACGGALHLLRREAFAENVRRMLSLI